MPGPGLLMGLLLIAGGLALLVYPLFMPIAEEEPELQSISGEIVNESFSLEDENPTEDVKIEDEAFVLTEWHPMKLVVPAIDLDIEVISGGVFNEELLQMAPVHFEMSDLPSNKSGNVAIAAHRRGNAAFFRELDQLRLGDFVYLEVADTLLVYRVVWNRIVEADDWSVIDSTEYPALTLQTCEPKDSPATHRLIVRANYYNTLSGKELPGCSHFRKALAP